MHDQNSTVEHQIRPDALMDELGIKKDSYYTYLKQLEIKAEKDSTGKVYLNQEQANLMRQLRSHVLAGGKIEEFSVRNSEPSGLVCADAGAMSGQDSETVADEGEPYGLNFEALMTEAAELAGHRMTMGDQLVLQLASQMTYEDLPDQVRTKVDRVREATRPKFQPETIATNLLNQWRQQRSEMAA